MNYLNIIIKKYDRVIIYNVGLLCVIGIVMLYSASSIQSLVETGYETDTTYLISHLKRLFLGIAILIIFMFIDYRNYRNYHFQIILCVLALLVFTKLYYMFNGINRPSRWIYLGPISVQTSDIARLGLIIFLAGYIDRKKNQLQDFYTGFLPPILIVVFIMFLIVIQPDFSTAILLGSIGLIMLFIGGANISHLLVTSATGLCVAVPVLLMESYRMERVLAWLKRKEDISAIGYQAYQSLISLGNGGILGRGLGNSMEKNMFLPEPHTDFIFSIIGEEIGYVGILFILTLFLLFFQRGLLVAKNCPDSFGILLALGISFSIILYSFVNAAVVTNLIPVTGLPMPLISYGGSGLVVNLASIGILLNISQSKRSVIQKTDWRPKFHG